MDTLLFMVTFSGEQVRERLQKSTAKLCIFSIIFFSVISTSGCKAPVTMTVVLDEEWVSNLKPGTPRGLLIQGIPGKSSATVAVQDGAHLVFDKEFAMSQDDLYVDEIISSTGKILCADGDKPANCIVAKDHIVHDLTNNEFTMIFIKN